MAMRCPVVAVAQHPWMAVVELPGILQLEATSPGTDPYDRLLSEHVHTRLGRRPVRSGRDRRPHDPDVFTMARPCRRKRHRPPSRPCRPWLCAAGQLLAGREGTHPGGPASGLTAVHDRVAATCGVAATYGCHVTRDGRSGSTVTPGGSSSTVAAAAVRASRFGDASAGEPAPRYPTIRSMDGRCAWPCESPR